jgi:hypothetical protein
VLTSIKIETLKYEYERAAETDVFKTGDTAYKQQPTPHAGYKCLYVYLLSENIPVVLQSRWVI